MPGDPATTPNLGLARIDTMDQADLEPLWNGAVDLIDTIAPVHVTELPDDPVDGQEVYYLAANGTSTAMGSSLWHLRYVASDDAWYFAGGHGIRAFSPSASLASGLSNLMGWVVTVPFSGVYVVDYWASCNPAHASNAATSEVYRNGSSAGLSQLSFVGAGAQYQHWRRTLTLNEGDELTLRNVNASDGTTRTWSDPSVVLTPIRLTAWTMFFRRSHADRLDALETRVERVEDTLAMVTRGIGAIEGSLTRIASTLDRMAKHFPDPDDDAA